MPPPAAVVALGACAGGTEAVTDFVAALPRQLDAAVLVVLHDSNGAPEALPRHLGRVARLPVAAAHDGEVLVAGRIYVAPADAHLRCEARRVRLDGGPRVNGLRPAADVLFASVAEHWGERGIGIVLSGALDDGTLGLATIRHAGGRVFAQAPEDAAFPSMPTSAARVVPDGASAPAAHLAARVAAVVAALARSQAPGAPPGPDDSSEEGGDRMVDVLSAARTRHGAAPAALGCPECGATLWERDEDGVLGYRCRVGHTFSPESLLSRQLETLERALWAAVVALEERGELCERLLARHLDGADNRFVEHYRHDADAALAQARVVRGAIDEVIRAAGGD